MKYPQETGLPWRVRFADADPHATLNAFASRRRLLLAGLGLLSVLVVAGSYFIWRAMARELAAARLQVTFLVRSAADPAALVHVMDRVVPEVAKDVAISAAETVDSTRRFTLRMSRFFTWLLVAFAGAALALAAVGVFGVMSYEVARRTHEIGIRMVLGAHPRDVLRLILRNGLFMTSIGLAIGLGSSLALARFLEIRLGELGATEVKPTNPGALVAVCLLLALVALLACYIMARRAARTNPLTSLRYEWASCTRTGTENPRQSSGSSGPAKERSTVPGRPQGPACIGGQLSIHYSRGISIGLAQGQVKPACAWGKLR